MPRQPHRIGVSAIDALFSEPRAGHKREFSP
jgi:hypothetical protein